MIGKYVLLVEDNPDEVVLTERAFQRCQISYKLVIVNDGREALNFLFSPGKYSGWDSDGKPTLILLDLNLPLVSGLQVLKAIRSTEKTSKVPVLVLTSSSEDKDQAECYRLGANEYIRKPTGFSQFVGVIQQMKSRWLESNESQPAIKAE
jgi:two-component system, response regulator